MPEINLKETVERGREEERRRYQEAEEEGEERERERKRERERNSGSGSGHETRRRRKIAMPTKMVLDRETALLVTYGEDMMKFTEKNLNETMTKKQKISLLEARAWDQTKKENSSKDWSKWHRHCGERQRQAPLEMRRELSESKEFQQVGRSSKKGRLKKKKNDRASQNMLRFLKQREERRDNDAWYSDARNAEPKLASQWYQYLERHEWKSPIVGRTTVVGGLLDDGGGGSEVVVSGL